MTTSNFSKLFIPPSDPDQTIWRYLDLKKFIWCLQNKALFFSRADRLGDNFEGSYTYSNVLEREIFVQEYPDFAEAVEDEVTKSKIWPSWVMVSCWHMNDYESAAMWTLYGGENDSVAIKSSYRKLQNVLPEDFYIGKVKYIDYTKEPILGRSLFSPFFHKRKSFEHENELRAVKWELPRNRLTSGSLNWHEEPISGGITVPCSLNDFVEAVHVSPKCEKWFEDLVTDLLKTYEVSLSAI